MQIGGYIAAHSHAAGADGSSGWSATTFFVGPCDVGRIQVTRLEPALGNGPDDFFLIVLRVAHPGHPVAAHVHHQIADFLQQGRFILRPHQQLAAGTQQSQGMLDHLLLAEVGGDQAEALPGFF